MEFSDPFCYTLYLSGEEKKRVIFKKTSDDKPAKFQKPVTLNGRPKIYILKAGEKIVYIGYASQSIGTRLGQGMRAGGLNGYHGYKWKQQDELELIVFVFDHELKGSKHEDDEPYVLLAEAVEAELVYKVRKETGEWPEFQNEIHFNNEQLKAAKRIAADLYDQLSGLKFSKSILNKKL